MRASSIFAMIPFAAACSTAVAEAPPPVRGRTEPAVVAAFARDTAVAIGMTAPVARDRLVLSFEQVPATRGGFTIVRVDDPDHRTSLRLVITDDELHGPRAVAAWPL
jgi:hypothetical protein